MQKANDVLALPGFELVLNDQHAERGVARDRLQPQLSHHLRASRGFEGELHAEMNPKYMK